MKLRILTRPIAVWTLVVFATFISFVLSMGWGAATIFASEARNGQIHVTKDCTDYTHQPGGHCTIASSNLLEIPAGTNVFYDQAAGIPTGLLDSNVVLDAGRGDRAVGRCTLDFSTGLGLCTFSDGTGRLTGFTARVKVSHLSGALWAWDGTYRFSSEPER